MLRAVTASLSRLLLSLHVEHPAAARRGLVTVWYGDASRRPSPSDDFLAAAAVAVTGRQLFLSTLAAELLPTAAFLDPALFDACEFGLADFCDLCDETFARTLPGSPADRAGFFDLSRPASEPRRALVGVLVFDAVGKIGVEGSDD